MKFLVFCFENEFLLTSLIKIISENYKLDLSILNEFDFIKSNNSYIYKNQKIINKILNLKKDFDEVDQVLYFESKLALIPYINIVRYDDENLLLNILKNNCVIPKYFINENYDHYYLIEFNIIEYIKFIQLNNTFDKNIDKLKDLNNFISNFDVVKFNIQFKKINVFSDFCGYDKDIFDTFIDNIKELTNTDNNDFYNYNGDISTTLIITDDKINNFINKLDNHQLQELIDTDDYSFYHTKIEVHDKLLNKIKVDYMELSGIYNAYKDNRKNILISDNINWDYINENHNKDGGESYFVIECNYPDKVKFV